MVEMKRKVNIWNKMYFDIKINKNLENIEAHYNQGADGMAK